MDSALSLLAEWLPHQRWFAGAGREPRLRLLADIALPVADPDAAVHVLIVCDDASARPVVYQVPVVVRPLADAGDASSLIGRTTAGLALLDGAHDPAFTDALLQTVAPGSAPAPAHVLSGEQSNTSVIYRPTSGHPIICKIFRRLHDGLNPDIELQSALAGTGSPHVPAVVGVFDGTWQSAAEPSEHATGSLAFAQEFFPGVEDAWRVALRAADAGDDFSPDAEALGRATAEVHLDLARLFPASSAGDDGRAAITEAWRRRLDAALAEVPPLQAHEGAIRARYAAAADVPWPALQRIHGDYHLGQVLQVPGRGWVLLDFEGEPMRPMRERRTPDLAARDLAGMLRSFDYVAGSLALSESAAPHSTDAARWAADARTAFLEGYRAVSSVDPSGPLLDALELDKAVYEAIYETRHRPGWLAIPLAAIDRLLAR